MTSLSILDLVRVTQETDARGAFDNARDLAAHAERWGYPTATHSLDFAFDTQGHTVRVVTLDLREAWNEIRIKLLDLLNPWKASTLPVA